MAAFPVTRILAERERLVGGIREIPILSQNLHKPRILASVPIKTLEPVIAASVEAQNLVQLYGRFGT